MNVYKNIFVDNKITLVIDMAGWMFRRVIGLFRVSNPPLYLFSIISLVTYWYVSYSRKCDSNRLKNKPKIKSNISKSFEILF